MTVRLRDSHPFRPVFHPVRLNRCGGGCSAFARHYLRNRFFSSRYLDVSLHAVPFRWTMCSSTDDAPCRAPGFPIRTSQIHTAAHASSALFVVYHVLLRHCSPSHSPMCPGSFFSVRTLSRGELVVLVLLLVLLSLFVLTLSQVSHASTPRSRYSKNRIRSFVPGEPRGLTDSDCGCLEWLPPSRTRSCSFSSLRLLRFHSNKTARRLIRAAT